MSRESQTVFQWPVRIYYEDTDAGGIVYHSNYLKYFERARTEMLRSLGVSQHQLLAEHTGFVVRHMDIDFIKGATLDEEVWVNTTVESLKRATLSFCQELVNDKQQVLCAAKVKVACVDTSKMKPKAIPSDLVTELVSRVS